MTHYISPITGCPVVETDTRKPRVVIVDDNPMTIKLARHIFEEAGWNVDGYLSPLKALQDLKRFEPDLIVTDFRMPLMNGPDFLLLVEKIHATTPKLVMTAYDDEESVQSVLRKASVPVVSKAAGLTEVLAAATKLVSVRQAVKAKVMHVASRAS